MKWLYYRFIYRRLMTLAHRFNWHHTRTLYPDGDTLLRCDWCGLTYVKERRQPVIMDKLFRCEFISDDDPR